MRYQGVLQDESGARSPKPQTLHFQIGLLVVHPATERVESKSVSYPGSGSH